MNSNLPIHAIVICVLYHDFLALTLPRTLELFDQVTVVTTPDDVQTKKICNAHGIKPLLTDRFTENEAQFNKGAAIQEALKSIDSGWVLLLDADILIPVECDLLLTDLNPSMIYGCERRLVVGSSQLQELQHGRKDFPLMRPHEADGKPLPIGFFQLFHRNKVVSYPSYPTAAESDAEFAKSWRVEHRQMLPITVWHLDSVESPHSANWWGRTTPLFT